jgi:hypothetical protein
MNPWDQPQPGGLTAPLRGALHHLRVIARDALHNRRSAHAGRRFLVLRQRRNNWNHNDHFLSWVGEHAPEALRLFELRRLPGRVGALERYALVVPWLQDPVRERFPRVCESAKQLEVACAARGIATINPVDNLSNARKTVASTIIRGTGIRTPTMVRIDDPEEFVRRPAIEPPFLVREDEHHGAPMVLVTSRDELRDVRFASFVAPVASEFIDTRGTDGLYRRYRYVAIGDRGFSRSVRISPAWESRRETRVINDATLAEDQAYLAAADPNHDALQRARRALGLDVVAFDYGYDREGGLVVFEPNPLPNFWDSSGGDAYTRYQYPLFDAIYGELLAYYLRRAGSTSRAGDEVDNDCRTGLRS